MRRYSEQAVALIMTLIMLTVITVVAVAFLALTQRERTSVSQSTYQSESEIMAEVGFERAKGIILSQILFTTNLLEPEFMVSRTFVNTNGFDSSAGTNLFNVNYERTIGGGPLSLNDTRINIGNLFFDPRPPVFINTNVPGQPEILDFRFYLDLNRNGHFETNGYSEWIEADGRAFNNAWLVGDPEWIGVLANPNFPHSRSNQFVGRYAYMVLPIGKSLDINHIYNNAKSPTQLNDNWYFRNQGYGSWELNLAAFLVDLNTNAWQPQNSPYSYNTNLQGQSSGIAFDHAREMLIRRMLWLPTDANALLANAIDFLNDSTDNYADGPLDVLGRGLVDANQSGLPSEDLPSQPWWPGAYNPTNYYTPHDFFDLFPPGSPVARPFRTGTAQTNSYDRYTFYRMLAQLSTGSGADLPLVQIPKLRDKIGARQAHEFIAEPLGKININYENVRQPAYMMTNWTADGFFNTVADVLIRAQFPNASVTNLVATNYNFIVHRLLQVAANLYDSTRGGMFPSVFRPRIIRNPTNITQLIVNGYYEDADLNTLDDWQAGNPTGVPLVIGSKKGLPNFNEFAMECAISAGRKLEFVRTSTNDPPSITNQLYMLSISNFYAAEAWNSYTQSLVLALHDVNITVSNLATLTLTNKRGGVLLNGPQSYMLSMTTNVLQTTWSNYPVLQVDDRYYTNSFIVPLWTNFFFMPESALKLPSYTLAPTNSTYDPTTGDEFPVLDLQLLISNRLTFVMSVTNRIIDYADLRTDNFVNISSELAGGVNRPLTQNLSPLQMVEACWSTNQATPASPPDGVLAQINISLERFPLYDPYWKNYGPGGPSGHDREDSIHGFKEFMSPQPGVTTNLNLREQAPYTPGRRILFSASFEVNDPLVHHMVEHLISNQKYWDVKVNDPGVPDTPVYSLRDLNRRYSPWYHNPKKQIQDGMTFNWGIKDAGVTRSDDWDFPTNKFPSVGWLGKVHRGTPWQTIYLKPVVVHPDVRNQPLETNVVVSAQNWRDHFYDTNLLAFPTVDWGLLDVFTTAIHPNASHGQLSINQTNFAAWSAALSGVCVLQNRFDDTLGFVLEPRIIEPNSPELQFIYEGIQRVLDSKRGGTNNLARTFRRLGEILEVEELTAMSPFLNRQEFKYPEQGITDAAMERIPQQILSLLKVGDPRFVVYAFGQSLRPAERSILTSGPYIGMCTNYQITGEAVTRTVLQIRDNAANPKPVIETFNILRED